jgi:hypothetical protein
MRHTLEIVPTVAKALVNGSVGGESTHNTSKGIKQACLV